MWTQHHDLHSHSQHSDGDHVVDKVAQLMFDEGVLVWSLTDHDTTSGWEEGAEAAARRGMRFVPGVEITCEPALAAQEAQLRATGLERPSASWHLLAYFPDHQPGVNEEDVAGFKAWLAPKQDGRLPRMKAMCERLSSLGMPVDIEDVCRRASGSVGRPHLAEAMVELGYVATKREAFETWIGDGLPGFVQHEKPTVQDAAAAVKSAGGMTSLAHPRYYGVPTKTLVSALVELGVDSIEAVHRSHNDAYRHELMTEAIAQGLSITVGSDFHGLARQPRPGNMPIQHQGLDERLAVNGDHQRPKPPRTEE